MNNEDKKLICDYMNSIPEIVDANEKLVKELKDAKD